MLNAPVIIKSLRQFFNSKIKVKDCPLVKPYKDGRLFFCINIP